MSRLLTIHSENPQPRLIRQAVAVIQEGGVIVYPTDSGYALGCLIGEKEPLERIKRIRQLPKDHHFTLVCPDLSVVASYAYMSNTNYRLIRSLTPGPYTFILPATAEVPRRLKHSKRKTIGIRIPDNAIALALLANLQEPLMSTTLILPDEDIPMLEPQAMYEVLGYRVDLIIDGGNCGAEPTTVLDLVGPGPMVIRKGKGRIEHLS